MPTLWQGWIFYQVFFPVDSSFALFMQVLQDRYQRYPFQQLLKQMEVLLFCSGFHLILWVGKVKKCVKHSSALTPQKQLFQNAKNKISNRNNSWWNTVLGVCFQCALWAIKVAVSIIRLNCTKFLLEISLHEALKMHMQIGSWFLFLKWIIYGILLQSITVYI